MSRFWGMILLSLALSASAVLGLSRQRLTRAEVEKSMADLGSSDLEIRRQASRWLGDYPADVPDDLAASCRTMILKALVGERDEEARRWQNMALAGLLFANPRSPEAEELSLKLLTDPDSGIRGSFWLAYEQHPDPRLLSLAEHASPQIRREALEWCAKQPAGPDYFQAFVSHSKDPDVEVRRTALQGVLDDFSLDPGASEGVLKVALTDTDMLGTALEWLDGKPDKAERVQTTLLQILGERKTDQNRLVPMNDVQIWVPDRQCEEAVTLINRLGQCGALPPEVWNRLRRDWKNLAGEGLLIALGPEGETGQELLSGIISQLDDDDLQAGAEGLAGTGIPKTAVARAMKLMKSGGSLDGWLIALANSDLGSHKGAALAMARSFLKHDQPYVSNAALYACRRIQPGSVPIPKRYEDEWTDAYVVTLWPNQKALAWTIQRYAPPLKMGTLSRPSSRAQSQLLCAYLLWLESHDKASLAEMQPGLTRLSSSGHRSLASLASRLLAAAGSHQKE